MTVKPLFTPPRYCRNPHIQSALNSIGPRKIRANRLAAKLNSEYLILTTEAGVRLAAEYDLSSDRVAPGKNSLVILIHGWEGSSRSAYQVTTAKYLLDRGFDVLRLNMRDHGDTQHLNRGIFNSTMTAEVGDAIGVFLRQHSYPSVFLAGFSLGGNFTLRIAADRGTDLGLKSAVAISPPVDPVNAMKALNQGSFIYKKYFMHGTSHYIGLDTHDVCSWTSPIQAGNVFTCEPGIYIPEENLGIRLEDDLVVQENGAPFNLMSDIPIEAEAIEDAMNG